MIDWSKNKPQTIDVDGKTLVVRVRPAIGDVEQKLLFSDTKLKFYVWYLTTNSKLTGYSIQYNSPKSTLVRSNYIGLFYSSAEKESGPMQIIYEDSTVRFLSFGKKFSPKDYLLVARWQKRA